MKEIIGNKESPMAHSPIISRWKTEIFGKKIAETFNWFFLNNDNNLAASIPKSKTTFQNYIHYNGPCLSTINFTDLEFENEFGSLKINKSSGYNDISVGIVKRVSDEILFFWNILSLSL